MELLASFLTLLIVGAILIYGVFGGSYLSAKFKARVINAELGTSYTTEEVFFASDVIDLIRQIRRQNDPR